MPKKKLLQDLPIARGTKIPVGPFLPRAKGRVIFAMAGDEPLMFQPERELNAFQKEHLAFMRFGILSFAMAMIPLSKPGDAVVLDDLFREQKDFLDWHLRVYGRLGLKNSRDLRFVPTDRIHEKALGLARAGDIVSTVCFSYALHRVRPIAKELKASKDANSKIALATRAEVHGYRTPDSVIAPKRKVTPRFLARRFGFPENEIVIKLDGLGGGFNVRTTRDFNVVREFLAPSDPNASVVVQEKIRGEGFDEYIGDFLVTPGSVRLLNLRMKLTANNQWFGNIYSPKISLTEAQTRNLLNCAQSLRATGYQSEAGYIAGMDFFQDASEQYIFDLNARWTGGLPVSLLLDRLGIRDKTIAFAHLDELRVEDIPAYREFAEKHLYAKSDARDPSGGSFRFIPLSFSPQANDGKIHVWMLVLGDYDAFVAAKKEKFGEGSLAFSDLVLQTAREKNIRRRYGNQAHPGQAGAPENRTVFYPQNARRKCHP